MYVYCIQNPTLSNVKTQTMNTYKSFIFITLMSVITMGCEKSIKSSTEHPEKQVASVEEEKKAILETLNNETKNAFQRDYEAWTENWVHDPSISKIYVDFADSTFSESVGWEEISQFVKEFIAQHPEPEPVPKLLDSIDVRLYGNGAWVTFFQQDSIRGLKRETRLMEKVNGKWKIAGMQTTIYGFESNESH